MQELHRKLNTAKIQSKKNNLSNLSISDSTIIKLVQAIYYQGNVWYGTSRCMQWSCMSLISASSALFRSPGQWNKLDLGGLLGKADHSFKSHGKLR